MRTYRVLVVDTETTGSGPEDQVVEIAVRGRRMTEGGELLQQWSWHSLVRPTCSVRPEARAAHHITDAELEQAPTMAELLEREPELGGLRGRNAPAEEDDRVLVAHSVVFDRAMLAQSAPTGTELWLPYRDICTYRCSLHRWPRAKGHSNQYLRYYLGVNGVPSDAGPPHRAPHDAMVTSEILDTLLGYSSIEELIRITRDPMLLEICRIGEHRGKPWAEVPVKFLHWIMGKGEKRQQGEVEVGFSADIRRTAQHWIDVADEENRRRWQAARDKRLGGNTGGAT